MPIASSDFTCRSRYISSLTQSVLISQLVLSPHNFEEQEHSISQNRLMQSPTVDLPNVKHENRHVPPRRQRDVSSSSMCRQKFTPEEDSHLLSLVQQFGTNNWKSVTMCMRGRTVRQCRERFKYYLEPTLNRNTWTRDEDQLLLTKFDEIGPKWSKIGVYFVNRSPIDLKNRFHLLQRSERKSTRRSEPDVKPKLPSIETILSVLPAPHGAQNV